MTDYTKTTNFAAKDSLPSGNANKIVKGAEIDTEFTNIATASATKADIAGPTFTGTVTIPTADINGGAVDGTTIGAASASSIVGTTIVANTSINIAGDGATVTGIKDEDDMSSNSATKLATQQSIKAYVDSQVTAQDLDVTDGTTSIDIDLDSESLGILGGTGIDSTASGTGVTLAIDSTVATLTGSQTLTNKTLTAPTLTGTAVVASLDISGDVDVDGTLETDALSINGTTVTSTAAELNILDGVTSTAAELNILDGVTSTTAELNILDGVTSTTAELNILDGVTATAAELNIMDGVTATTAELNIMDGVTSTTAELNILDGVTSTAAELNILDGKAFLDEDDMSSNSATGIASQQSIKAYVDAQITAEDLDFQADSGGALSIDLDSETLTFTGGTGIDTSGSVNTVTFAIDSTVATLTGSQTLTNKTLTSPDINTPDIDGGTIDNTVIGGSTAAAGSFTTGTFSGSVTITGSNEKFVSNSTSSGDYVRLYAASGTGKWDIYGNGANLRIGDNDSAGAVVIDTNVGIGVTPSAWHSSWKALQLGPIGFVGSYQASTTDITALGSNVYSDGTYKYIETDEAVIYKQQNGEHIFDVAASGSANAAISWTTAMTIDNSANVGIGTSSPAHDLDVLTSTASTSKSMRLGATASTGANNATMIISNGGTGDAMLRFDYEGTNTDRARIGVSSSAQQLEFYTAGNNERMRIDSSGNVGIGTSATTGFSSHTNIFIGGTGNIYADSAASADSSLSISQNAFVDSDGSWEYIVTDEATNYYQNAGNHVWRYAASGTAGTDISWSEAMRIGSNGSVGIGTTSTPAGLPLQTKVSSGDNKLRMTTANKDAFVMELENSTGNLKLGTNTTAGALVIEDAGNVAVGHTSSGGAKFAISDNGNATIQFFPEISTDTNLTQHYDLTASAYMTSDNRAAAHLFKIGTSEAMRIDSSNNSIFTGANSATLEIRAPTDNAFINIYGGYNDSGAEEAGIALYQNQTAKWQIANTTANEFRIYNYAQSSAALTIDSSGNVLFGTTAVPSASSGGAAFDPNTNGRSILKLATTSTGNQGLAEFFNPNGQVGGIVTNGSATAYNTSSDQRLKDNIVDAPSASDDIDAIQVRSFNWKADGSHQKYGMVAQELQTVAPEAVSIPDDPEEMAGVDYSKLVPMLIKEIQSLRARVQQLEN